MQFDSFYSTFESDRSISNRTFARAKNFFFSLERIHITLCILHVFDLHTSSFTSVGQARMPIQLCPTKNCETGSPARICHRWVRIPRTAYPSRTLNQIPNLSYLWKDCHRHLCIVSSISLSLSLCQTPLTDKLVNCKTHG